MKRAKPALPKAAVNEESNQTEDTLDLRTIVEEN